LCGDFLLLQQVIGDGQEEGHERERQQGRGRECGHEDPHIEPAFRKAVEQGRERHGAGDHHGVDARGQAPRGLSQQPVLHW